MSEHNAPCVRLGQIVLVLAILMMWSSHSAMAEIIPSDRRISWQGNVGAPGGIPERTTVYGTPLTPSGADDGPAIQDALNACPSDQVVLLGDGTFNLSSTLDWVGVKSGVVLRGNGPARTRLIFSNGFILMRSIFSQDALTNDVDLAQDTIQGADTVTLAAVPAWVLPGHLYILDQLDDPGLVDGQGQEGGRSYREVMDNGARGLAQLVKVQSKTATTVTFDMALYYGFSTAYTAQLAQAGYYPEIATPRRECGIEDLAIESTYSDVSDVSAIKMENCDRCWIRNVASSRAPGGCHVQANFSYRCEIRDSTFAFSHEYDAGRGYGVALYNVCSGFLVENNIFQHLHVAMMCCYGSSGNVFGYNYACDGFGDTVGGGQAPSISTHGVHAFMNLWEGNYCDNKAFGDWIHGSASHNTLFRNRILGYGNASLRDETAVSLERYNRKWNIVANVLGVTGWHAEYEQVAPAECTDEDRVIFKLGYQSGWACDSTIYDPPELVDVLRHGNYDHASELLRWDPGIADNLLPDSLYLASKPSFFGDWPWPYVLPDVGPSVGVLPAKQRFEDNQPPQTVWSGTLFLFR